MLVFFFFVFEACAHFQGCAYYCEKIKSLRSFRLCKIAEPVIGQCSFHGCISHSQWCCESARCHFLSHRKNLLLSLLYIDKSLENYERAAFAFELYGPNCIHLCSNMMRKGSSQIYHLELVDQQLVIWIQNAENTSITDRIFVRSIRF